MPKIVDETERQNEIADAAVEVFADHGFSATTVQQIADEAGMSKGNIYLYFDSKEEVLQRVFNNFRDALHETLDESVKNSRSPSEKIETLISNLISLAKSNRSTIKVLFDFWSHSLHDTDQNLIDYDTFYRRIEAKLVTLLEDGSDAGRFRSDWHEELPSMLIGFFEGQLIQWLINPSSPSLEDVGEAGTEMLMEGLSA